MTTRDIPNTFGLEIGEWILHCTACGFAHEKMTAASNVCPNCRANLMLSIRYPQPAQPTLAITSSGRMVCYSAEYMDALMKIFGGDQYIAAFEPILSDKTNERITLPFTVGIKFQRNA